MKYNKIFLVGFRTTGKSTLGKIIADKLSWSLLDMDFLITRELGENIDLITKGGTDWSKFRKTENETLKDISQMENAVISCGGGVGVNDVIDKETGKVFGELNKEILKNSEKSLIVLLTSDEEKIKERLRRQYKNKKIMPALNPENAIEIEAETDGDVIIEKQITDSMETYKQRKPLYEKLTEIKINTDSKSLMETAEEIINYAK